MAETARHRVLHLVDSRCIALHGHPFLVGNAVGLSNGQAFRTLHRTTSATIIQFTANTNNQLASHCAARSRKIIGGGNYHESHHTRPIKSGCSTDRLGKNSHSYACNHGRHIHNARRFGIERNDPRPIRPLPWRPAPIQSRRSMEFFPGQKTPQRLATQFYRNPSRNRHCPSAVSYTHLTLPTIYSV